MYSYIILLIPRWSVIYSDIKMLLSCTCRVYLDSDYHEPSPDLLPSIPMVEEVKDCSCIIA